VGVFAVLKIALQYVAVGLAIIVGLTFFVSWWSERKRWRNDRR
jgi:hypothetical protein